MNERSPPTRPAIHRTMNAREWAMLLLLSLLWGCSFFLVAVALTELPPITIVWLRVSLAAVALNLIAFAVGVRMPTDRRSLAAFAQMALLNNVIPFLLLVWGQTQVASGVASIINATTPIFTTLIAHVTTTDEKMTTNRVIGVIIGFVGIVAMIGTSALNAMSGHLLGEIAILCAAVFYACSSIFGRRFSPLGIAPLASAAGMTTASAMILLPMFLVVDQPWTLPFPSTSVVLAVLSSALFATTFAYLLFFRILATAGATNLMLVTFLQPVTAIILGVSILGERLEPRHLVGMALIAFGLSAIDGRIWQRLRARTMSPAE
jgi:drug/metabolite transporter (DMT)-like permease